MTPSTKSRRKSTPSREELYRAALGEYLSDGSEVTRGQAYDLGRTFLKDGVSLVELATIHHSALSKILRSDSSRTTNDDLFRAAEFLSESLSSYEMAHRGFQEAVSALRRMNEVLEEEIKRIAYSVHDEAGQLLVAVHLALADVAREAPDSRRNIDNITDLLKKVEVQLRQFSHELRPTILDDLGLVPAIRFLAGAVSKRSNRSAHSRLRGNPGTAFLLCRNCRVSCCSGGSDQCRKARAGALCLGRNPRARLYCSLRHSR